MKRVLIVDDNEHNLYLLRALMQGNGFIVAESRNGAEALQEARQNIPDLVISDLLMPVMDGYTLLRQWKADAKLLPVPFVVYTATYTEPRDEQLALDLGADAFIVKPAEPEPFMVRIKSVMSGSASEAVVRRSRPDADGALVTRHNDILVAKLHKKVQELEQANEGLLARVTQHEQTEAALRQSEERYRKLFNSITDPIFVYDRETLQYLAVNDEAVSRYGFSEAEFLTMTVRDLIPEDDLPLLKHRPAAGGAELLNRSIWRNLKKSGEIIEVELSAFDLDFCGRPTRVVQARDVTEQRRLESQVRQAQKMEAVGRLAGGVAHDFNNLLTVIDGYCDVLQESTPSESEWVEPLAEIRKASTRAEALTSQLLSFSRQQMVEPQILDLNAVVLGTEKMLRRLVGADVEMLTKLDVAAGPVTADTGQIEQVLMNLVINARDAMPGGGTITIETQLVELDETYCRGFDDLVAGDFVLLAVSDTGTGMDTATRTKVFEPFFTTKAVGRGTGLGLSTVHGIVKQSHGHVSVYSEPGHGTTFKVYLPLASGPLTENQPVQHSPEAPRGSETVLLVEDDDSVRPLVARILTECGYSVLTASNGKDAICQVEARTDPVDLLVSDVVMPNMGGRELAQHITALHPDCKVLFMSGYTDDAVIRHGAFRADFAFLQKPFTPAALALKVRGILS